MDNSSLTVSPDPDYPDYAIIEIVAVSMIALIGMFVHFLSILVMTKHQNFRNSFGYQMSVHSFSNFCECTVFGVFVVPCMIWGFGDDFFHVNMRIGQLLLFFCLVSYHTCVAIAINRVVAIGFPYKYKGFYTTRNTTFIVIIAMILSLIYASFYSTEACYFYYDKAASSWLFSDTPMARILQKVDMWYSIFLFTIVGICDVISLTLLRQASERIKKTSTREELQKRFRREIRFLFQAIATSIVYICVTFCYHVISYSVSHPLLLFFLTTVMWPLSCTMVGVVLIIFNAEMQRCFVTGMFFRLKVSVAPTTVLVSQASQK